MRKVYISQMYLMKVSIIKIYGVKVISFKIHMDPISCFFNSPTLDKTMIMAGHRHDHIVKNKKYTTPLPYLWDAG